MGLSVSETWGLISDLNLLCVGSKSGLLPLEAAIQASDAVFQAPGAAIQASGTAIQDPGAAIQPSDAVWRIRGAGLSPASHKELKQRC